VKRWWASPEDSVAALSVVDDSDVVNGVGVALLGYHGLSQGALQPLTKETLVDVHHVREALLEVDLEPVAKALGEATKSVMGDASERYGQLLASEVHKRAIVATERLLTTWTTNGMAWPQAIEKAAEVHGVPLERLGRYATVMKSVGMTPHVRADYADRELMAYAADFGKRESVTDTALIEKQEKRKEFNEKEHPRNPDGEFKSKNAEVTQISDKLDRLDKLNRLNRLNGANRRNLASIKASATQSKISDKTDSVVMANPRLANKRLDNKRLGEKKLHNPRLGNVLLPNPPERPAVESDFPDVVVHRWSQDVFIPLTKDVADEIRYTRKGIFFAGQIKGNGGAPLEAFNAKYLKTWLELRYSDGKGGVDIEAFNDDGVQFIKSNETPVDMTSMESERMIQDWNEDTDYANVAPRAKFSIKQGVNFELISSGEVKNKNDEDIMLDVIFAQLENGDYEQFYKNLNSNDLQNFNEEHPRDQSGRFAEKQEVTDLSQARLDKLNKLNRLNKINNLNGQRAAQMKGLVASQKEVHENVRLANKRLENRKLSNNRLNNKRLDTRKFDSQQLPKIIPEPLNLDKSYAYVFNQNLNGSVSDPVTRQKALNDYPSAPQPFYNRNLEPGNGSVDTAFQKLMKDVDKYNSEHPLNRQYLRNSNNDAKLAIASGGSDAEQVLMDNAPNNGIANFGLVWQPGYDVTTTDDGVEVYYPFWESQPEDNKVEIILGSKEQLEALKNGHATIVQSEEYECMFDLLKASIIEDEIKDTDDTWEIMFGNGSFDNVATNPPVSVYTVKMGKGN